MIESQQLDRPHVGARASFPRFPAIVHLAEPVIDLGELIDELKVLRKGRGLFVTDINERVRPTLRRICGITERDGPAEIRRKVAHRLESLACALPADLRVAAMAAFALTHDAQHPLYQDRVEWTAARINRDPRTARRRIDDAIHQLAQLAAAQLPPRGPAATGRSAQWHTNDLRVVVTLDGENPQAIEHRQIVACRDGLAELELAPTGHLVGAVHERHDTVTSVLYGGIHQAAGPGHAPTLRLPRVLHRGETHEYALQYQVLSGEAVQPRVAHVPTGRCDHLEIRVRFGPQRPPRGVWAMSVMPLELATADVVGTELPTDAAGEVHLSFDHLVPGRTYGLRWAW